MSRNMLKLMNLRLILLLYIGMSSSYAEFYNMSFSHLVESFKKKFSNAHLLKYDNIFNMLILF